MKREALQAFGVLVVVSLFVLGALLPAVLP